MPLPLVENTTKTTLQSTYKDFIASFLYFISSQDQSTLATLKLHFRENGIWYQKERETSECRILAEILGRIWLRYINYLKKHNPVNQELSILTGSKRMFSPSCFIISKDWMGFFISKFVTTLKYMKNRNRLVFLITHLTVALTAFSAASSRSSAVISVIPLSCRVIS